MKSLKISKTEADLKIKSSQGGSVLGSARSGAINFADFDTAQLSPTKKPKKALKKVSKPAEKLAMAK